MFFVGHEVYIEILHILFKNLRIAKTLCTFVLNLLKANDRSPCSLCLCASVLNLPKASDLSLRLCVFALNQFSGLCGNAPLR